MALKPTTVFFCLSRFFHRLGQVGPGYPLPLNGASKLDLESWPRAITTLRTPLIVGTLISVPYSSTYGTSMRYSSSLVGIEGELPRPRNDV